MRFLASILPYATLITAIMAMISGGLTWRQSRRARALTAAVQLVQTIQPPEFARSIQLIIQLPENADPKLVLGNPEVVTAAYVVSHVFESLAVLVFYRLLPLHLVDHLIGGYVRVSWNRLRPYVENRRALLGATFGEWFQWLDERMEENPAPGKVLGAATTYRNWRG